MNYYTITTLLVVVFSILLGVFVYLKNRNNRINSSYFLVCLSLAIWNIMDFLLSGKFAIDSSTLLTISRFSYIGINLFPTFVAFFVLSIVNEKPNKYIKYFIYLYPLILSIISITTPYFVEEIIFETSFGITRRIAKGGLLYNLFILYSFWIIFYWFYKLIPGYKKMEGQKRFK